MVRFLLTPLIINSFRNSAITKMQKISTLFTNVSKSQCRLCCNRSQSDVISPVSMTYASYKSVHSFSEDPPIVIMHGLLGSKLNWKSVAKFISQESGRTVFTVDARNHGESPHSDEFNYFAMAADLVYFLKEHSISKACLIGHSMGGRSTMLAALQNPNLVEKLFVVDISPFGISDLSSSFLSFVEIMRKTVIPSDFSLPKGRKYMDTILLPHVSEIGVRQFILSNLLKIDDKFCWRVNLDAIALNYNLHITKFPLKDSGLTFDKETHFIGGGLSDYIRKEDHPEILKLFPQASFNYIEGAGHWVHAEKPQEFFNLILPFLK